MGFRFNKRLKILPGVHLNLGLGGASLSVGGPGASVNIGRRGVFGNVGIPGTGLSYRQKLGGMSRPERRLPDLPGDVDIKIVDDRIVFVDGQGREITGDMRSHALRSYREQAEILLGQHADSITGSIEKLRNMHLDSPPPGAAPDLSAGYPVPKPSRTEYSSQELYMEALMGWRAAKANHESLGHRHYDPASLERALELLQWPRETNISYQCSEDGRIVLLDVDLPEIEDMPDHEPSVNRRDLLVRMVPMSGKRVADIYSAHVASSVFRLAAAAFAATPAQEVRISGYTQRASSTGRIQDEYVIAAVMGRAGWQEIDFASIERIDPENALRRFGAKMERTGRGALRTVLPCPPL